MKKLIEIDNSLYDRLEFLQSELNVKSLAPIIDIALTLGIRAVEKLVEGATYPYYVNPLYIGDPFYVGEATGNFEVNHKGWKILYNNSSDTKEYDKEYLET